MRLKWVFIVVLLAGCGQPRPPQLNWPASASIDVEGEALGLIETNISDLNTRLESQILSIGSGVGSPIYIKKVDSFSKNVFGELAYVGFPGVRGFTNTKIAGRATLVSEQCTIELADFLMVPTAKDLLLPVLWHEIGHCAGLTHVSPEGELMSPVTLPFFKYSEEHLTRFFDAIKGAIYQR